MNSDRLADFIALCARLLTGATVRASAPDSLDPLAQRVYVANHSSHLDFIVLWAALPGPLRRRTRPVAAKDYWNKTAFRRYLAVHVYHAILIERENVTAHNNPIDLIAAEMGHDYSLILFPEGTRGQGDEVGAFKGGIYHLVKKKPHLQCVPVYLENLNRILPKGEVLLIPLLGSISVGAPLQWEEGEPRPQFLERLRAAVCALRDV